MSKRNYTDPWSGSSRLHKGTYLKKVSNVEFNLSSSDSVKKQYNTYSKNTENPMPYKKWIEKHKKRLR
jgi:TFIIF-interacting CTD phosphatase-like protein